MSIISILGITCTGKDTLAERIKALWPDEVGLIQVGKEFRRRYPPGYFKGKGAMVYTEEESWQIFDEQMALCKGKQLIVVVGQPRMVSQLDEIMKRCHARFYLLTCNDSELRRRINKRFEDQKEGWLTLALERVTNDKVQHYDLLVEMASRDIDIEAVYDTTNELDEVAHMIYEQENTWAD